MTDKKPNGPGGSDGDKPKLPPRSGDWHSGLKREDPGVYKATAPETVSDFVMNSGGSRNDPPDWDPVEGYSRGYRDRRLDGDDGDEGRRRPTIEFYGRASTLGDWLIAFVLGVIAFFSVVLTYDGIGHSWDEALYLKPAERAAAWMVGVFNSGDDTMLQRETVDRHWGSFLDGYDPLHPEVAPVPKLLLGAGLTYLQGPGVDPMMAMRLPIAILFGLTVGLLFLLGNKEYGRIGGFAAAVMYALMPRVFGHAHIAASETALAFFTVLTVWWYLKAVRFWPLALFTGIAFGIAAATKITVLMLPVPLMIWGQIYKRRDYASNVFAMAFLAPVVMLVLWPWLWYDGLKRFFAYLIFYVEHQATAVFYMNRIWGYIHGPIAPWYYPLHITALVLPFWILFFLAIGLVRALFSSVRRPVTVLFVLMAASWIGLCMLPSSPKYDGERLFFPAFAFLALVAGGGFAAIFDGVRRWRVRRGGDEAGARRETGYIAAMALGVCIVYGAVDLILTHPNELNYYNWLTGRARGAYVNGMETSYWGEAVNEEVLDYLNEVLEPGDNVKTLALNDLAFENLRRWGKLPENVDFTPDYPPYDYVVMQIRQGFMGATERQLWRGREPLRVFEHRGVPRIMVFAGANVNDVFPQRPDTGLTTGTLEMTVEEDMGTTLTVATDGATTASAAQPDIVPVDVPTTVSLYSRGAMTTGTVSTTTEPLGQSALVSTATEVMIDLTTEPAAARTNAVAEPEPEVSDVASTSPTFQPPRTEQATTDTVRSLYTDEVPSTAPLEVQLDEDEGA